MPPRLSRGPFSYGPSGAMGVLSLSPSMGLVDNSLEGRVQGMGNKAVLGPLEEALYDYMGSPKLTPGSSVR